MCRSRCFSRTDGQGAPDFSVALKNRNAVRAITSLDQVKFADAYLAGDIDINGDMLRPFALRQ
jgi:cyclopropane-fatty-acyl-phospholipid synthase